MKFSIITVCRNSGDTLESTIKSVLSQSFKDFEFIVIDGKSADNTPEILKKYKNKIDTIVSEKDGGIFDAMNKGLARSNGEYIFFLNANDTFFNNHVLKQIAPRLNTNPDILCGNVLAIGNGLRTLNKFNHIDRWFLVKNSICHQAMFTNRRLFAKFGQFTTKYKIAGDYDWLLNVMIKNGIKIKYTNITIANFSLEGVSSNKANRSLVLKECQITRKKYFMPIEIYLYNIYSWIAKIVMNIKRIIQ